MKCKKHSKENCQTCFPKNPIQCEHNEDLGDVDDGFLVGLVTGMPVSPMGAVGAMMHDAIVDSSPSYDSSYDSSSSCDSSSFDSGSCGGDW